MIPTCSVEFYLHTCWKRSQHSLLCGREGGLSSGASRTLLSLLRPTSPVSENSLGSTSPLPESHHHSSPWLLWSTPGRASIVPGWSPCSKAPCMWPEGPSPPVHPFWPHWLPCQHGPKSQAPSCLRAFVQGCFCCLGCFSYRDSFTALKSVLEQQHCAGLRAQMGATRPGLKSLFCCLLAAEPQFCHL